MVASAWALLAPLPAHAQNYRFPTSNAHYDFFYPTSYFYHADRDWNCGFFTRANHRGSDFGAGSFLGMDAGRDVVAAADGIVSFADDGNLEDRCTTGECSPPNGNYVKITHPDGNVTFYLHLKAFSIPSNVSIGALVTCGQKIGEMGSSGNSEGPHLHFQLNGGADAEDPFTGPCNLGPSRWVDQGPYPPDSCFQGVRDSCKGALGLPSLACETVSQKFELGDRVEVVGAGTLNVRDPNACDNPELDSKPDGAIGIILGGPIFCEGHNRWRVRWDDCLEGWSAETWLEDTGCTATLGTPTQGATVTFPQLFTWTRSANCSEVRLAFATSPSPATLAAFPAPGSSFSVSSSQWDTVKGIIGSTSTYYWTAGESIGEPSCRVFGARANWRPFTVTTCGNSIPEPGEQCDDGSANGTSTSCCNSDCTFKTAGTVCRPFVDTCDFTETCTGSSGTCPADLFAQPTVECRSAVNDCDQPELCTGNSPLCPPDAKMPNGTICRPSTASCDPAEACTGVSRSCPEDVNFCGVCGNGIREGSEQCDGTDLGTASCLGEGFGCGAISCNATCTLNTSACSSNECFPSGATRCLSSTTKQTCGNFDPDACLEWGANETCPCVAGLCSTTPVCGNGIVETGEECDDGNTVEGDGCSANCLTEFCGDGVRQPSLPAAQEECDGTDDELCPGLCTSACFCSGMKQFFCTCRDSTRLVRICDVNCINEGTTDCLTVCAAYGGWDAHVACELPSLGPCVSEICGDVNDDGVLDDLDIYLFRLFLADPNAALLSPVGTSKCTVIGEASHCDILDLVVLRRALAIPPLPPGIAPLCEAAKCFSKWGTFGNDEGELSRPIALAVDPNDNIYVAESLRIQKFDSDGNFLHGCGFDLARQTFPGGLAVDGSGNLYVTWTLGIDKLDSDCNLIFGCGGGIGDDPGEFYLPSGIAIDKSGDVYVADTGNHRIQKFDLESDCTFLGQWGTFGSGQGEFDSPTDVAVDVAGNVYVTDFGNSRIQKFNSNGDFITEWGTPGFQQRQFNAIRGVAADASGNVYVSEGEGFSSAVNHRIQKFDSDGNFLEEWGTFCNLYSVNPEGCTDPDGSGPLEFGDGQFNLPRDVVVDTAGKIYVADHNNHRIQRFACP